MQQQNHSLFLINNVSVMFAAVLAILSIITIIISCLS
ncbi:Uncharacterised protein [Legionella beliardensis]|uniref:Uncharacterized protein n=1 Tax=Legionella beliardensis TaxID=91822 RepID=A0A378I079_9GAMM|nr:Uncharacterised protein [Legionella beliardensis]